MGIPTMYEYQQHICALEVVLGLAMAGRGGVEWRGGERKRWGRRTSVAVMVSAAQSTRGRMLYMSLGFSSMVSETSSQSLGWRGKEAMLDLHALTAQVRKLSVSSFIILL